ncbi:MAG: TerC/Alx family metal homeostasis membrane protein [Flavobacterium sp.]|nr:MAG: TerC/Alx family metal homeostasis membrane protein [Flavobacterium sp.]
MIVWILFLAAIFIFLALDLGVFNRNAHIISSKEAGKWTAIWVAMAFAFSGVINWLYSTNYVSNPDKLKPSGATIKYITGYLIELSLSIDNIFIIAIIFSAFKIAQKYQHRVLFWGIIGAIAFRGLMIYFGVLLINKFDWITYVFGAFLIFTAVRMLIKNDEENFDPKHSLPYRIVSKIIPTTHHVEGKKFFLIENGRRYATPLFIALIVIEVMDVVFAADSVPAILAITSDPFLVFSSNIFAILGLRSMYFFLANMIRKFVYVEYSLIAILTFVGVKMLLHEVIDFPEWASLSFIAVALLIGILVSIRAGRNNTP